MNARQVQRSWMQDAMAYWPVILSALTIIAFIVNAQRDIADVKSAVTMNGQQIQIISARADTLQDDGKFRDLVLCELLASTKPSKPLPKRCGDVFQGWGYP